MNCPVCGNGAPVVQVWVGYLVGCKKCNLSFLGNNTVAQPCVLCGDPYSGDAECHNRSAHTNVTEQPVWCVDCWSEIPSSAPKIPAGALVPWLCHCGCAGVSPAALQGATAPVVPTSQQTYRVYGSAVSYSAASSHKSEPAVSEVAQEISLAALESLLLEYFPELNCTYYRTPFFISDTLTDSGMAIATHRFSLRDSLPAREIGLAVPMPDSADWMRYCAGEDIDPPIAYLCWMLAAAGKIPKPRLIITD